MINYNKDCPFCRMMRSFAFAGLGMGIGSLAAYFFGASKQNMMITGIFTAAIIVFGILDKKDKR